MRNHSLQSSTGVKRNLVVLLAVFTVIVFLQGVHASVESFGTFKKGQAVNIIQTYNATVCNITSIISPNSTIYDGGLMTKNGFRFSRTFLNTSETGSYSICGSCDGTAWCGSMEITPNGQTASIGTVIFYVGLLAILVFFLVLCISAFRDYDNLLARVGMMGLSYLLLIAITFIGWNMASDFLTSAPFLIAMLRILFFVFIIGAFPLLIGMFAWYVLMLFKIKEIQRLMGKGMSEEEAERRTKRGGKYR